MVGETAPGEHPVIPESRGGVSTGMRSKNGQPFTGEEEKAIRNWGRKKRRRAYFFQLANRPQAEGARKHGGNEGGDYWGGSSIKLNDQEGGGLR